MNPLAELNSYRGDPGLAGGTSGVDGHLGTYDFKYSWDALDRLTALSFQQNRDIWYNKNLQAQKEAEESAKQLNVDYGNLIDEDKKVVDEKLNALLLYYNENPGSARRTFDYQNGKDNAKQYTEFLKLSKELNYAIGRGNLRAEQLKKVQDDMSTATDPGKLGKYQEWIDSERKKPIAENIILMPPMDQFNLSKYISGIADKSTTDFGYVKIMDNNNLEVTKSVFDPDKALSTAYIDFLSNDPTKEDMKSEVMKNTSNYNAILKRFRGEDGTLDVAKMKASPDGQIIADLADTYNQYINMVNTNEVVEGVKGETKKKIFQFLGYDKPLDGIDISDGIEWQEFMKMALVNKLNTKTKADLIYTGSGNQRRNAELDYAAAMNRLNFDKDQIAQGKKGNKSIADEVNQLWFNIMTTPFQTGATAAQGNKYEIPVTPQLQNALTKSLGKEVNTEVTKGMVSNRTVTKTKSTEKQPQKMYVIKGNNADASKVEVLYDNGSKETYDGNSLYNSLNGIWGNQAGVQQKVSQAKIEFLQNTIKARTPSVTSFEKYYGDVNNNPGPQNPAPVKNPNAKELPVKNGKVDASGLVKNQLYSYNGKVYKWNGTKLVESK